jgi:nitrile hydratase accessory protein
MKAGGIEPEKSNFAAPWEARAFALAVALANRAAFSWEEFRRKLIEEIADADAVAAAGQTAPHYYECWLSALEQLLTGKQVIEAAELERRADQIAANPPAPTRSTSPGPVRVA